MIEETSTEGGVSQRHTVIISVSIVTGTTLSQSEDLISGTVIRKKGSIDGKIWSHFTLEQKAQVKTQLASRRRIFSLE